MGAEEVICNNSGGGGGWGDPREREAQRVLDDVINDFVSLDAARRDYGVAIDAEQHDHRRDGHGRPARRPLRPATTGDAR